MAKLYFKYGTMNCGKSIDLLKTANNYEEKNEKIIIFVPSIDTRYGTGKVTSRIGIQKKAEIINKDTNVFDIVQERNPISCVLIDEAQFLSKEHVIQLTKIVDILNIPVITFGIKTDFQAKLFPGSEALLCYADEIEEIKTICWKCNKKAIFNMRINSQGQKVHNGSQIMIGGNDSYIPVCRKHFFEYEK